MALRAFVDGQEGTTGLRIHEYLSARSDVEVLRIDAERRKDAAERGRLLNEADVAFLCLPDDAAREAVAMVRNPKTCVIDASTAHRTVEGWAYGLPELAKGQRDALRASKRIANPGCHATAFILLARPLVDAGLLSTEECLSAYSLTGYSGGGKKMIEQYRAGGDPRLESPRPYALGLVHKHLPEMRKHGGLTREPVFSPIVGNWYKGLAVSIGLPVSRLARGATAQAVRDAYAAHYDGEPFVNVLPVNDPVSLAEGGLDVQACNDTNRVDVMVFGNDPSGQGASGGEGRVMVFARLDNLGKGASGAAVQAMNVHFGLDETLGLA